MSHTFIVRIGLRKVRIPSGLPGSGKRIGRMRPAAIISSTRLIVDVRPAPSDELLLESDRPSIPEPTCIKGGGAGGVSYCMGLRARV